MTRDGTEDETADTAVEAEPEETLKVFPWSENQGSRQLLATYRYGDLRRDYYWDKEHNLFSVCDGDGMGITSETVDVLFIDGKDCVLRNHHVYFVGDRGDYEPGWTERIKVFYMSPQDDTGPHVLADYCAEWVFTSESVRVNYPTVSGYYPESDVVAEYEDHWKDIPLK